jgi:DNA-binding XRE family transcriptional regulator
MKTVGTRVAAGRRAAGITQEDLARAAGITTSTVQKIEAGKQMPRLDTAAAITRVLRLKLADLLEEVAS